MPGLARLLKLASGVAALALALTLSACSPKGSAPQTCGPTQLLCNGKCVDFISDAVNCGGCGVTCPTPQGGTAQCINGLCGGSCPAPSQICGVRPDAGSLAALCTDVTRDPVNCGACGNVCLAQQTCNAGVCTSCPAGQLQCPISGSPGQTQCKAVLSDNANCGGCGNACTGTSSCQDGACVAPGQSNCGNADGGAATSVDLQNDRANCGACGTTCIASEICRSGDCVPCPGLQVNNRCVDIARDGQNCGAVGTVCTGTNACVQGKCGAPVLVTILPPISTGKIPQNSNFGIQARVDSALPLRSVQVQGFGTTTLPDGGTLVTEMSLVSPANISPSVWSAPFLPSNLGDGGSGTPNPDGGFHLVVTAYDVAWRADAGDATQHVSNATVDITVQQAPDAGVTVGVGNAAGSLSAQNVFVPLNADPITFRASVPATNTATSVQFINAVNSYILGTAPVVGGVASLTVAPADLTSASGVASVVACPVDSLGQGAFPFSPNNCASSNDGGTSLVVGRIPVGFNTSQPVLTAAADGGSGTIVFMGGDGGQIIPITTTQVLTSDAGTSALPSNSPFDAGYGSNTLVAAETSSAVLATRADGASLDRFDCVSGTCTRTAPYVSAGTAPLNRTAMTTGKTVLLTSSGGTGQYFYAFPATASGALPAGFPVPSATYPGTPYGQTAGGGIVVLTQSTATAPASYQVKLIHPSVGITTLATFNGPAFYDLFVAPTGEIIWHYQDTGKVLVSGAFFDGATTPTAAAPVQVGGTSSFGWAVVRPKLVGGIGIDFGKAAVVVPPAVPAVAPQFRLFFADLTKLKITAPSALFANTGDISRAIRSRQNTLSTVSISDDALKAIYVTQDLTTSEPQTSFTLWITDLANTDIAAGTAPLFTSPYLSRAIRGQVPADFAAHFVHSLAGTVGTIGGPAAATVSAPGAVVWGEDLLVPDNGSSSTAISPARLYYALYKADTSAPAPVLVDRLAVSINQSNRGGKLRHAQSFGGSATPVSTELYAESASGAQILFVGYQDENLYAVNLNGTATSTFVADAPVAFMTREDKTPARLLVHRTDGVLLAGKLQPGVSPGAGLAVVLEGLTSGPLQQDILSDARQFGFTADGDHAFAFTQMGADFQDDFANAGLAQIETVDLNTSTRVNFGRAFFNIYQSSAVAQACFLANSSTAISVGPLSTEYQAAGTLFSSTTPSAPLQTPLASAVNAFGSVDVCATSLDGSEGLALVSVSGQNIWTQAAVSTNGAFPGAGQILAVPNNFSVQSVTPNRVFGVSAPATNSPFGGPYLDEYDLLQIDKQPQVFQIQGSVFKIWGEAATHANKGYPFIPVTTGFIPSPGTVLTVATPSAISPALGPITRPTDGYGALLFNFQSPNDEGSASYLMELPLAGNAPPPTPLP